MVANHLSLLGQNRSKLATGQLVQALRTSFPVSIRLTNVTLGFRLGPWTMNGE